MSQITSSDVEGWRRPRSESSADAESVYMTNAVLSDSGYAHGAHSRRSSVSFKLNSIWTYIENRFYLNSIFEEFIEIYSI